MKRLILAIMVVGLLTVALAGSALAQGPPPDVCDNVLPGTGIPEAVLSMICS